MPIGTSKSGLLGAGVVPGGSETFNTCGTFCAPPGVSVVNVTGFGGAGGCGAAGNPGGVGAGGAGGPGGNSPAPSNLGGQPYRAGSPGGAGGLRELPDQREQLGQQARPLMFFV